MDLLQSLALGFEVALSPVNIFLVIVAGVLGTIVGMLPGIGPAAGVAVLIPITFGMDPNSALITMAGVYYGCMYGGSRSSILINTPGDGSAIAATFDGYPMARNDRAEAALAISAIASFIGGLIAIILMILIAQPMARMALKFGPGEYFMLMVFALTTTVTLSRGNYLNGLVAVLLGLMLSTVGIDSLSGVQRFTFGLISLQSGIDFMVVIIAMFALGEVFKSYALITGPQKDFKKKFKRIWITREDWRDTIIPILRNAPLGFVVGVLPGAGGTMASLLSYANEKQLSRDTDSTGRAFGEGNIIGLAAPESANNAASVGALIPMFALGIPGSGTTAVMLGALLMLGLQPGPALFTTQPQLVWGIIASLIIGNVVLAIINIPLAGLLVRVLAVPPRLLYPIILGFTVIGVYAITYNASDLWMLIIFGLIGVVLNRAQIPIPPLILALIIGYQMEQSFRQVLLVSRGDYGLFFASPIAKSLLALSILSLLLPFAGRLRALFWQRQKA